jgi:hypothetical protein
MLPPFPLSSMFLSLSLCGAPTEHSPISTRGVDGVSLFGMSTAQDLILVAYQPSGLVQFKGYPRPSAGKELPDDSCAIKGSGQAKDLIPSARARELSPHEDAAYVSLMAMLRLQYSSGTEINEREAATGVTNDSEICAGVAMERADTAVAVWGVRVLSEIERPERSRGTEIVREQLPSLATTEDYRVTHPLHHMNVIFMSCKLLQQHTYATAHATQQRNGRQRRRSEMVWEWCVYLG